MILLAACNDRVDAWTYQSDDFLQPPAAPADVLLLIDSSASDLPILLDGLPDWIEDVSADYVVAATSCDPAYAGVVDDADAILALGGEGKQCLAGALAAAGMRRDATTLFLFVVSDSDDESEGAVADLLLDDAAVHASVPSTATRYLEAVEGTGGVLDDPERLLHTTPGGYARFQLTGSPDVDTLTVEVDDEPVGDWTCDGDVLELASPTGAGALIVASYEAL